MCQGDSGRPREHFGEGSGTVRKRFGGATGNVRDGSEKVRAAAGEPAPDPPVDISM